jgi:hypothetical protein
MLLTWATKMPKQTWVMEKLSPHEGSMSQQEETQRRASIKAVLADETKSPMTKRRSIQHLMDGRRTSLTARTTSTSSPSGTCSGETKCDDDANNNSDGTLRCHVISIAPRCDEQTKRDVQSRPPCTHYQRKCNMIAACCGASFGCRFCHDECPVLPPPKRSTTSLSSTPTGRGLNRAASLPRLYNGMTTPSGSSSRPTQQTMSTIPADFHHAIDRFAVKEVICRECFTRQSSKT